MKDKKNQEIIDEFAGLYRADSVRTCFHGGGRSLRGAVSLSAAERKSFCNQARRTLEIIPHILMKKWSFHHAFYEFGSGKRRDSAY